MLNIPLGIVLVTYSYSSGPVIGQSWVFFILIWANLEIEHGIPTQTHYAAREKEYVYHISYEYPKLRKKNILERGVLKFSNFHFASLA